MNDAITVFVGPGSSGLGPAVCDALGVPPGRYECRRFPDGEAQIDLLESVRGKDVYLLQATSPPADQRLMEVLLLADACRRSGAARLTAVVPYLGYARQDRRSARRSLGARVVGRVLGTAGFDRLMLIDAHTAAIEGFVDVPVDHLTAVPLLAGALASSIRERAVVVSPDLGAVRLARAYARHLHVPMAIVHKTRLDGEAVAAHSVVGDVAGRLPLIVDDMLSTGATIEAAVGVLRGAGAAEPVTVALTHALLVGPAREILSRLRLAALFTTDTVIGDAPPPEATTVCSVAPLLAAAIRRNHQGESLVDLRASP